MSGKKDRPKEPAPSPEKKIDLKQSILNMIDDFTINEVTIVEEKDGKTVPLAYIRMELGGDAFQIINTSDDICRLHHALIGAAMENRLAVWRFIQTALS